MDKIDFVLPWVNPMDQAWQERKATHSKAVTNTISNSQARYRDMETLKFVLRSIEKNCPWYNKIYLITEGHVPDWLDLDSTKVVIIPHEILYYNKSHLPTFNSSSIEMNLANIPGLSENFVFLNDDTVIMKITPTSRFFKDGVAVDYLSHGWLPRNKLFELFRPGDAWYHSIKNNLKLVNDTIGVKTLSKKHLYHKSYSLDQKISNFLMKHFYRRALWIEHWHHPQPYTKKTLNEVLKAFKEPMMQCSENKFRKNNDLTQYLYRYWRLFNGDFLPMKHNDALSLVNIKSLAGLKTMISNIEDHSNVRFVCFNDSPAIKEDEFELIKEELLKYLEYKFPEPSSFEINIVK